MKLYNYRVYYSVFVNGEEYPKDARFQAMDAFHAESQLKTELGKFPENRYMIHRTEKEN